MAAGALDLYPGSLIAGKYLVERVLAQGGMGAIALCRHEALDQRVAVKLLLPEAQSDDWIRSRFLREAKAAARLQSHHVARVSDVGTDPRLGPFYVMEYLEGCDLKQLLQARQRVPVAEGVDLVLEAIDAIAEAHALGIVHRDLKPANLFLADRTDGSRVVKVLDFGISKNLDGQISHNVTAESALVGSPSYLPPEQLSDARSVDARADQWSLGVVLYELLTGYLPFEGATVTALLLAIADLPPRPPRAVAPELPVALEAILLRCLEKAPGARFPDVAALARSLLPFGTARAARCVVRAETLLGHGAPPVVPAPVMTMTAPAVRAAVAPAPPAQPPVSRSSGSGAAIAIFVLAVLVVVAGAVAFLVWDA